MTEREAAQPVWSMPRLTKINRLPRALGFAATFVALTWLTLVQGWSHWNIFFAGLCFLVYPQLVYWFDYWRRAQTTIEYRAMMFDAFMLGAWVAHVEFSIIFAFSLLTATVLNNTIAGGARQCARGLAWHGLGMLVVVMSTGFNWSPSAPQALNAFFMAALLVYIFSVALPFNTQNQRLLRIKRSVERANSVFQSMLNLTELTNSSDNFDEMVQSALNELQRLYPDLSFGFVLKDRTVSDDVHFAAFTDNLTPLQQSRIRSQVAALNSGFPDQNAINIDPGQPPCLLYPLTRRFGHLRGILIVQGSPSEINYDSSLQLLINQLNTAISNKLLTMELKEAAERDALTGVYNRGQLDAELARAQSRQQHNKTNHFSVLLIDLIGLKGINDQLGHEIGDYLICEAANALQEICRENDKLFRFGGDEFVILCNDQSGEGAKALADRILTRVHGRQITLGMAEDEQVKVTLALSVGLASSEQVPPDRVLKLADQRMYEQKRQWYQCDGYRRDESRHQVEPAGVQPVSTRAYSGEP